MNQFSSFHKKIVGNATSKESKDTVRIFRQVLTDLALVEFNTSKFGWGQLIFKALKYLMNKKEYLEVFIFFLYF